MLRHPSRLLEMLILVVLAATLGGCRQLAQHDQADPVYYSFHCDAEVGLLPDASQDPDVRFNYLGVGKPADVPELVRYANGDRPVELYRSTLTPGSSAPWIAQGLIPPELRGAWLVRLDTDDRTVSGSLLEIDFDKPAEVDTVWLGFDTRATEPEWVGLSFDQATDSNEFETTMRTATDDPVRFRLWRLKEGVDLDRTLELGGNADPTAVWPGGTPGAQYLVFVRQKPVPATGSTALVLGRHRVEECSTETLADVQKAFDKDDLTDQLSLWITRNPGWAWAHDSSLLTIEPVASSCTGVKKTSNGTEVSKTCYPGDRSTQSAIVSLNDWRVASTAEIDPALSTGTIGLDGGEPDQASLSGRISFASRDDGILELDEVSLWAKPFSSGGLDVSWATFGQMRTIEAECVGQSFPHTLCDGYRIPDGGLELYGAAHVGDYRYSAALANEGPVDIEVDLASREFAFVGGPFEGAVLLEDGSRFEVSAELRAVGRFVNFAPVPLTHEGEDRFACLDNRSGRVRLDAGASYDAEGAVVDHQWIEDAGAPTQRLLGVGSTVELDLGLGFHDITLVVEDTDGTRAFTRGSVEVFDDDIDNVVFPPDAWAVAGGGSSGTAVVLGAAGGSDACAGSVVVIDDGPDDRFFPDGLSLVNWTVDDGNGHVIRQQQRVLVVPASAGPPPNAWIAADPIVGAGDVLRVDFGTSSVGHGVVVDEYLLVTAPDGDVWSVDARGALRPPGPLTARARGVVRGITSTSDHVAIDEPGRLGEDGLGVVQVVLVLPSGDPLDPRQIVGWDGATWRMVR